MGIFGREERPENELLQFYGLLWGEASRFYDPPWRETNSDFCDLLLQEWGNYKNDDIIGGEKV